MTNLQDKNRVRVSAALLAANPALHGHLFGPGPKRILALDGGGVLGVIELAFLERIETLLRERCKNPKLVLSDYFDLIGGTSTGSIIATGLAMGMTATQIKTLYFKLAREIFQRPLFSVPGLVPQFDARVLANKLRGILGERQLQSTDLQTGLAIVAKRIDTGSPWVLFNHPMSKFWDDPPIREGAETPEYIGNKRYKLRDLVRASTAAPYYYSPKRIRIVEGEPDGLFVDGGISPHNNPSLQLLMMASIKGYGFHWPVSADNLMMISIGCGWIRPRVDAKSRLAMITANMAIKTLRSLVWDAQVNTLKIMQWISEPRRPWPINSEVGSLEQEFLGVQFGAAQELIKFQRYDMMMEDTNALSAEVGETITKFDVERMDDFLNPDVMTEVYRLAQKCAKAQVDLADFPPGFDPGAA